MARTCAHDEYKTGVSPTVERMAPPVAPPPENTRGGGVGGALYEFFRQIPYLALLGMVILIISSIFALDNTDELVSFFEKAAIDLSVIVNLVLSIVIAATLGLGGFATFISLMSRGALREILCRGRAQGFMACVTCCVVDLIPRILTLLSFLALIVQLLVCIVLTALVTFAVLVNAICGARAALVKELLDRLAALNSALPLVNVGRAEQSEVDAFCSAAPQATLALGGLLAAFALIILGQVLLLMSLNSSLAFAAMERRFAKQPVLTQQQSLASTIDLEDGDPNAVTPRGTATHTPARARA